MTRPKPLNRPVRLRTYDYESLRAGDESELAAAESTLQIAGKLGQRVLGEGGFYAVSLGAGLVSSASGVAAAAVAHGAITGQVLGLALSSTRWLAPL